MQTARGRAVDLCRASLKQTNRSIDFRKFFKNIMIYKINTPIKNSKTKSIAELDFKKFQHEFYCKNHQKITYAFNYLFDDNKDLCDGLKPDNFHYYEVILGRGEGYFHNVPPEVVEEFLDYVDFKDRLKFFADEYKSLDPNMFEYYQYILDKGMIYFNAGLGEFLYDISIYKIQSAVLEMEKI